MLSLGLITIVLLSILSITVIYGLYRYYGYPDAFDNKYFKEKEEN